MIKILIKKYFSQSFIDRVRLRLDQYLSYKKITYSQFGEDLFLREYFSNRRSGFYVDIGAFHPKQLSNTYYLYSKLNWRGINIEANPDGIKLFRQVRKHDINVHALISDKCDEPIEYYNWGIHAENSMHPDQVRAVTNNLGKPQDIIKFQPVTLSDTLSSYCKAGQKIDFMNIDVEGHDLSVLKSNNWEEFRPRLLAIEQFGEHLIEITESDVYHFITDKGYELVAWYRPTLFFADTSNKSSSSS